MQHQLNDLREKIHTTELWKDIKEITTQNGQRAALEIAKDEKYWREISKVYDINPSFINLNHGSINPMPKPIRSALFEYLDLANELPGYWFFEGFSEIKEDLRNRLAKLVGVHKEELSIQRNTSSAMETAIFGLPLQPGDEVILSRQDYPTLVFAWQQREKYEGIALKWIDVPMPSNDSSALINAYTALAGPKTKVIQVMQMFNWNGQLIPIEGIAKEIATSNIELMVDGAHIAGQMEVDVSAIKADYWATSLHKWISGPIGTGLLTVKKDLIRKIKPLMGNDNPESDDIRKFENFGIHNTPIDLATHFSLDFLELLGPENKSARLQYLKRYALEKLAPIKNVEIHSHLDPLFGCALGLFSIKGKSPDAVQKLLFDQFGIYTVGFEYAGLKGVRISPNIYNSIVELDILVDAVLKISKS